MTASWFLAILYMDGGEGGGVIEILELATTSISIASGVTL